MSSDHSESDPESVDHEKTTMMIKHLPPKCKHVDLISLWSPEVYSFNVCYMPYSFKKRKHHDFAFINFKSSAAALAFRSEWQGKVATELNSKKEFDISWATVQGYKEHTAQICLYEQNCTKPLEFQAFVAL